MPSPGAKWTLPTVIRALPPLAAEWLARRFLAVGAGPTRDGGWPTMECRPASSLQVKCPIGTSPDLGQPRYDSIVNLPPVDNPIDPNLVLNHFKDDPVIPNP